MQYRNLGVIALAGAATAAYVPSEPWSTLTPSATFAGGKTDYTGSFGIAINPLATPTPTLSAKVDAKKLNRKDAAATQIGDGQVQATTGTANEIKTKTTTIAAVTQIGDGQIQATTNTPKPKETAQPVTQIGDGQIQATTATETTKTIVANVVTQIGDGQIQATTATISKQLIDNPVTQIGDGQIQATTATVALISQIGDGQIQATTATPKETAQPVTQIGDGQVQATTATAKPTAQPATQIGDGQVQATTATPKETAQPATQIGDGQVQATTETTSSTTSAETKTAATQIGDGQVQATTSTSSTASSAPSASAPLDNGIKFEACASNGTLSMTLEDGILKDSKGRIGSIVANQQFQFDGPPPQAGAIYAAGWSISEDGKLAIGNSTTFYQCLSGNFYNLYAHEIGSKCEPVELDIVELVQC